MEIVIVMAILAILMAVITPSGFRSIEKAKIIRAIGDYYTFRNSVNTLYADTGRWIGDAGQECPLLLTYGTTDLDVDLHNWNGWDGPYVEMMNPVSPWGGTYYLCLTDPAAQPVNQNALWVSTENYCYPNGPSSCGVPRKSAIRIDSLFDDGENSYPLRTGGFIGSAGDYCVRIAKDVSQ
jgi:general secretion pathway protein G